MQKQNRLVVPITLVVALLFVGGVGYIVLKNGKADTTSSPNAGDPSASTTTTARVATGAGLIGPPISIDPTKVQVLVAKLDVPKGTTLDAAMKSSSIDFVVAIAGEVPEDALGPDSVPAQTIIADVPQGAILTSAMFGTAIAPPPTTIAPTPCPADAVATPAADSVIGIRVKGPVPRGMSAGAAAAAGLFELVSVPNDSAPFKIVSTLSSICTGVAQFDLSPRTLLVTGHFA